MLKAIRFDEEKHKHLLKWINDFRDAKGKQNESEAVRHLMEVGFEQLKERQDLVRVAAPPVPEPVQADFESPQPINRDSLKRELMDEVMAEINTKMLGGLTAFVDKLNNFQLQPQVVQIPVPTVLKGTTQEIHEEKALDIPKPKKRVATAPIEGNALLANLLGNADR